jgi:hypothetical protein
VANNFGLAFGTIDMATANVALAALESGHFNDTGVDGSGTSPQAFALHQNVPNPFNPVTRISFDVPAPGAAATLEVYDVEGKLVRTLAAGYHAAGTTTFLWRGRDDAGRDVASGTYVCRLTAAGAVQWRKMLLLR